MPSQPNIVAVHDYGKQDATPLILMEPLPGNEKDQEVEKKRDDDGNGNEGN